MISSFIISDGSADAVFEPLTLFDMENTNIEIKKEYCVVTSSGYNITNGDFFVKPQVFVEKINSYHCTVETDNSVRVKLINMKGVHITVDEKVVHIKRV